MNIIWIIAVSITGLYTILLLSYLAGWLRLPAYNKKMEQEPDPVSLIIPFRNEEENIHTVLNGIARQNFPSEKVEILFIDDHSDDNSVQEILSGSGSRNIKVIKLPESEHGKKSAIRNGLEECTNEIVLMLDADSELYDNWISDMTGYLHQTGSRLVFGPVRYKAQNHWERMQQLEFFSLVGTGAGACGLNSPIICNGTNMVFYRKDYLRFLIDQQQKAVSGDDVLFMLWVKKHFPGQVSYLKSPDSIIETMPSENAGSFFRQRLRWTSKSRYYKDLHIILSALTVFLMNFLLLFLLAGMPLNLQLWKPLVVSILIKSLAEFLFLILITSYYRSPGVLIYFIPLQMVYFIYVNFIAIAGNLLPVQWKGRKQKI